MAVAVEIFNTLPNRLKYGDGYAMQGYWEIEEVLAFKEIRADQERERQLTQHLTQYQT